MTREDILKSIGDLSPKQQARYLADRIAVAWDTIDNQKSEIIDLQNTITNYQE